MSKENCHLTSQHISPEFADPDKYIFPYNFSLFQLLSKRF